MGSPDEPNLTSFKLLLDPVFTNSRMSKCATWYVLKTTTLSLMKKFPNMKVYANIPDGESWMHTDDLFEDTERVLHVPMEQFRDRYKEYYFLKRAWLDCYTYWGTHWDWDILLTTRAVGVPSMRIMSTKDVWKRIVVFEPLPMVKTKKTVNILSGKNDNLHMQTWSAYLNSDLVVVNAGHEMNGILKEARRFLSPAKMKDLQSKVMCKYSAPTEIDLMFPYTKPAREPGEQLRVLYTQRMDKGERRPEMVWENFKYAFVTSGSKIDFQICLRAGQKIEKDNGELGEIEKVKIGERVLTHRGRLRPVTQVMSRVYTGDMVTLKIERLRTEQTVTGNHKFFVIEGDKCWRSGQDKRCLPGCSKIKLGPKNGCSRKLFEKYEVVEKEARDIYVGDYLLTPRYSEEPTRWLDVPTTGVWDSPIRVEMNSKLAEFCGWYAAEGSIGDRHGDPGVVVFSLCLEDEEVVADRLLRLGREIFSIEGCVYRDEEHNSLQVVFGSRSLADLMSRKFGRKAHEKKIPNEIAFASNDVRAAFVDAWAKGDGWVGWKNQCVVTTMSQALAMEAMRVLVSLDRSPTMCKTRKGAWRVNWSVVPKRVSGKCLGDWMLCAVESVQIENVSDEEVFNIEVEEDHSYVVGGVAVRNCTNTAGETLTTLDGFIKLNRPARSEFYERLKNAHVCCSWAIEEGVPLSLFEAACFGVICVVKSEPWSRDLYGPDYPWIVKNTEEAVAAIKRIEAHYEEEYEKYIEWYENFWLPRVAERGDFIAHLTRQIETEFLKSRDDEIIRRVPTEKSLATVIDKFCREHKMMSFDINEIAEELDKRGLCMSNFRSTLKRDHFSVPISRSVAFYKTKLQLLVHFGWRDGLKPGSFVRDA